MYMPKTRSCRGGPLFLRALRHETAQCPVRIAMAPTLVKPGNSDLLGYSAASIFDPAPERGIATQIALIARHIHAQENAKYSESLTD